MRATPASRPSPGGQSMPPRPGCEREQSRGVPVHARTPPPTSPWDPLPREGGPRPRARGQSTPSRMRPCDPLGLRESVPTGDSPECPPGRKSHSRRRRGRQNILSRQRPLDVPCANRRQPGDHCELNERSGMVKLFEDPFPNQGRVPNPFGLGDAPNGLDFFGMQTNRDR